MTVPAEFPATSLMSMSILAKRYDFLERNPDPMTRSSDIPTVWPPSLSLSSCVWPQSMSTSSVMRTPPPAATQEETAAIIERADRQARRRALAGAMAPGCRWCGVTVGVACGRQGGTGQVQGLYCRDWAAGCAGLPGSNSTQRQRGRCHRTWRRDRVLLGGVNKLGLMAG